MSEHLQYLFYRRGIVSISINIRKKLHRDVDWCWIANIPGLTLFFLCIMWCEHIAFVVARIETEHVDRAVCFICFRRDAASRLAAIRTPKKMTINTMVHGYHILHTIHNMLYHYKNVDIRGCSSISWKAFPEGRAHLKKFFWRALNKLHVISFINNMVCAGKPLAGSFNFIEWVLDWYSDRNVSVQSSGTLVLNGFVLWNVYTSLG